MLARARSQVGFISGPLEASHEYFATHYIPLIERGMSLNHRFILGAARGVDSMALEYFLAPIPPRYPAKRITLYLSQAEASRLRPRHDWFEGIGGSVIVVGRSHTERDEAMTRASHYDILRYRTEKECRVLYGASYRVRVSGTEKNEQRRMQGLGLVWRGALSTDNIIDATRPLTIKELPSTAATSTDDWKQYNLEKKGGRLPG